MSAPASRDAARHPDERAVAAEHDDEVARAAAARRASRWGGPAGRPTSVAVSVSKIASHAAGFEPPGELREHTGGGVEPRLRDDPTRVIGAIVTGYRSGAARCNRNSRLPSIPAIGESVSALTLQS